jgi:hypothetical protein
MQQFLSPLINKRTDEVCRLLLRDGLILTSESMVEVSRIVLGSFSKL